jgi:hypothetical protein
MMIAAPAEGRILVVGAHEDNCAAPQTVGSVILR